MEVINIIPVDRKYALTVEEAAVLTGIGTKKLYELIAINKSAPYLLHIGRKTLIKRTAFEAYLDKVSNL